MKKMYFLKDKKRKVYRSTTYMSKHRQEYLQDKEHGMITLPVSSKGMPVIRFSSGRVTSYWDFLLMGKDDRAASVLYLIKLSENTFDYRFVYFIFVQTVDMAGAGMGLCVAVAGSITVLCDGILYVTFRLENVCDSLSG